MANSLYDCVSKCIVNQTDITQLVKSCILECVPDESQPSEKYKAPLVWIGLYVAGASLVCMLLMAADLINGLHTKSNWFPCRFFTLNAAISAVLAIALKMPVDLTTLMPSGRDQLMKLCGTTLISVSMANFMPSLGDMSVAELFANLISLAVFIVPLISNICIQIGTGVISSSIAIQHVITIFCIILQFSFLISTAIVSTSLKKRFKSCYKKYFDHQESGRKINIGYLRKLWTITHTSDPQFVIARSLISIASGAICLVSLLVVAEVVVQLYVPLSKKNSFFYPNSDYEWSTNFIVVVQVATILVGSISPLYRWLKVVRLRFSGWTSFKDLWNVEEYWIELLRGLKNFQFVLNSHHLKFHKFIHRGKDMFLNILITFQILTAFICKFISLLSLVFFLPFLYFYNMIFNCKEVVLSVDKEPVFSKATQKKTNGLANDYIRKSMNKARSMKLDELLERAKDFDGMKEFNSILIRSLTKVLEDPSNSNGGKWTSTVVTLSIIAYTFTTTDEDVFVSMVNNVLLRYVRYVEKTVDVGQEDNDYGNAAMDMWYSKESLKDKELSIEIIPSLKTKLEKLGEWSEGYIKKNRKDKLRVKIGQHMIEIVEIVKEFLESEKGKEIENEQQLFDKMSGMVADILNACLVNLSKAIEINMTNSYIEKRGVGIKDAILIWIETEQIQNFVKKRLSIITNSQDYKEYVEESWWKLLIKPLEDAIGSSNSFLSTAEELEDEIESSNASLSNDEELEDEIESSNATLSSPEDHRIAIDGIEVDHE